MGYIRNICKNLKIENRLDREDVEVNYFRPNGTPIPTYRIPPSSNYFLRVDYLVESSLKSLVFVCRSRYECEDIADRYMKKFKDNVSIHIIYKG